MDIGQVFFSFSVFMDRDVVDKHAKQELNRTSLINKGLIMGYLGYLGGFREFFLGNTACNPTRTRKYHVARLGSQSQSKIWLVLPAHGANHAINWVVWLWMRSWSGKSAETSPHTLSWFGVTSLVVPYISKIDLHEVSMGVCAKNNSQVKFSWNRKTDQIRAEQITVIHYLKQMCFHAYSVEVGRTVRWVPPKIWCTVTTITF